MNDITIEIHGIGSGREGDELREKLEKTFPDTNIILYRWPSVESKEPFIRLSAYFCSASQKALVEPVILDKLKRLNIGLKIQVVHIDKIIT